MLLHRFGNTPSLLSPPEQRSRAEQGSNYCMHVGACSGKRVGRRVRPFGRDGGEQGISEGGRRDTRGSNQYSAGSTLFWSVRARSTTKTKERAGTHRWRVPRGPSKDSVLFTPVCFLARLVNLMLTRLIPRGTSDCGLICRRRRPWSWPPPPCGHHD